MEILIAMFLLAICIGLLAGTYPLLKASSRQADHLAMASLMAQAVMERKLGQDSALWQDSEGPIDEAHPEYSHRFSVAPWPENPRLRILRVEIHKAGQEVFDLETLAIP
jgi:Na+-translocating ferredoxin:NAD+ oxidoreductase RnfG subunit